MSNRCTPTMPSKMHLRYSLLLLSLAIIDCSKSPDSTPTQDNEVQSSSSKPEVTPLQESVSPPSSKKKHQDTIDPKSPAGAHAVLASYAELVEEKRWADARQLWTEGSETGAVESRLQQFGRLKFEVGEPGPAEGAAGSIYIEIPIQLTETSKSGEALTLAGTATLRRVNDVPGSTEVQRRWHIYRLDLQPRP